MGWLDKLLPWRKQKQGSTYADMLNGYTPIFSQFGNNIFASDVVQQCIYCIISEMSKLNPMHVRDADIDATPVHSEIQRVLNFPNEIMTKSEFIEKVMWCLLTKLNSFIVPVYYLWRNPQTGNEEKIYTALYPVQPTQVDFIQDESGILYIKMYFANGYNTTLPYSEIIHVRWKFSLNELMGGDVSGQPDNRALLETLKINDHILQGVSKATEASFSINGIVKYNTLMDGGKTLAAIHEFETAIKESKSGILPLDLKAEYVPINKKIQLVDSETLKFIDEKILRNWGVSLPILTGDYTKEQFEAFYQKTLEPFIIKLSQSFTKALFTDRARSFGNEIRFYPKDLIFMSVNQTIEMVRLLGDSGAMYENEKRVAFGMRPLPELNGVRKQSLNYVDTDIAKNYQLGGKNSEESA